MNKYLSKFAIVGLLAIVQPIQLKSTDKKNIVALTQSIKFLNEEKLELIHKRFLCNGVNIGLGLLGLGAGLSAGVGLYLKDKTLEVIGIVGTTIIPTLLITANCIEYCQNSCREEETDED